MARPSDSPAAAHLPAPGAVPAIEARGLTRSYASAAGPVRALRGVDLSVMPGEFVAIMGPSGSGKSTLMNVLGLLDRTDAGTYLLEGADVSSLTDAELAWVRAGRIGFVFQSFNLLPRETVLDNVCLSLAYAGAPRRERRERAMAAIAAAGLPEGYAGHLARELSGGQMQRVAIARALVADPAIVLADEPTGNLDSATGDAVMRTFQALSAAGRTVVLITHDAGVAARAGRALTLRDGVRSAMAERLGLSQARAASITYAGADALGLTEADVAALRAAVPGFEILSGSVSTTTSATWGTEAVKDMGVLGVSPDWFEAASARLAAGRLLDAADGESASRVVVLTDGLLRQLEGESADPVAAVGRRVTIAGTPFEVVGVLADAGAASGLSSAIMPLRTLRQRVGSPDGADLYTSVLAFAREGEDVDGLAREAASAIEARKGGSGRASVWPMKAAMEQSDAVMDSFQLLLTSIAGVSLLVGGIGIMNMMLTSVTERTREIGLRRALGARRSDIVAQFLLEAVLVCLAGGAAGMAASYAAAWGVRRHGGPDGGLRGDHATGARGGGRQHRGGVGRGRGGLRALPGLAGRQALAGGGAQARVAQPGRRAGGAAG